MNRISSIKEKVAKSIIQTLIDTYLGKDYILVHRKSYVDLLSNKVTNCKEIKQ